MSQLSDIRVIVEPLDSAEGMVHALAREALDALERYLATRENKMVDLHGLPLRPGDLDALREVLGTGEVRATLDAVGPSEIWETAISGVWWVRHQDEPGHVVAEYLEIGSIPSVLLSHPDDIREAANTLRSLLDEARQSITPRS